MMIGTGIEIVAITNAERRIAGEMLPGTDIAEVQIAATEIGTTAIRMSERIMTGVEVTDTKENLIGVTVRGSPNRTGEISIVDMKGPKKATRQIDIKIIQGMAREEKENQGVDHTARETRGPTEAAGMLITTISLLGSHRRNVEL